MATPLEAAPFNNGVNPAPPGTDQNAAGGNTATPPAAPTVAEATVKETPKNTTQGNRQRGNPVSQVINGVLPLLKRGNVNVGAGSRNFFDTLSRQAVGNGAFSPVGRKLLSNLAQSTLSVAVNQTLGAQVAKDLGFSPQGKSNFLGSQFLGNVLPQSLVQTGVGTLFDTVENSIRNSKALGPFGPLASSIVGSFQKGVTGVITDSLFGVPGGGGKTNPGNVNGTNYFPGADGEGDGGVSGGLYASAQRGGTDVVFSIRYASTAAKDDLQASFGNLQLSLFKDIKPGSFLGPDYKANWDLSVPFAGTNAQKAAVEAANPSAPTPATAAQAGTTQAPTVNQTQAGTQSFFDQIWTNPDFSMPSFTGIDISSIEKSGSMFQNLDFSSSSLSYSLFAPVPAAWKFICAPEDISWETTAQVDRVPIYGANQAPVTAGVKGMRELSMSNSIVEGFSRRKTIEDKIIILEELMNMSLSAENKFVQVPVFRVAAQSKVYGKGYTDGGYFIIKSVKIQEKMRDETGRATRATVDISFMQVPPYQVSTGRDIASKFIASRKGPFAPLEESLRNQSRQNALDAKAAAARAQNTGAGAGGEAPAAAAPGSSVRGDRPGADGLGTRIPTP